VVDEAIRFLRAAKPLPPLEVSKGMCLGAQDHIKDLVQHGSTGHKGSDGSLPEQRVSRYGSWQSAIGENIAYSSSGAREAVLGMIIDDGTPGRGHRLNIFNANHRVAGIAAGQPSPNIMTCVVTYAGGFTEKSASNSSARMF
ncbi:MAG TPA: CAP domain-containing protein, partial [Pyrinomonadaceae bacterium]|nr:CAP domain-containing protein [Pyrinomonadaceae bacterium]